MSTAAPAPSVLSVFKRRDFSLLWLAQLISTAGSSLTDLAAGIWVYQETGSALAVGLTLMATAVPSLFVGLLAGVYVDRHDRKRIMIATCLIQAVIVAIIALTVQIESVVGLYALLLLNAGVKQFFDPAHDSLIPEMASDEELTAANAYLSIASFGSTAIGFAGGRPAGQHGRGHRGLRHRRHHLPGRRRPHLHDGHVQDARTGRGRQRRGHRGQPQVGHVDAVRHADHPLAVRGRRVHVRGLRPVERAAPAVLHPGARRDRVRVRPPGGPDLGRLRHRLAAHGPLLAAAARARLDRRVAGRDGHRGHRLRHGDAGRAGHRAGHDLRPPPAAVVGVALGPPPAQHPTRDARPGVLGVLRHARRHLPDRHGRRRSGRHRGYPADDHRGLVPAVRVGRLHPGRPGPRASAPGGPPRIA